MAWHRLAFHTTQAQFQRVLAYVTRMNQHVMVFMPGYNGKKSQLKGCKINLPVLRENSQ